MRQGRVARLRSDADDLPRQGDDQPITIVGRTQEPTTGLPPGDAQDLPAPDVQGSPTLQRADGAAEVRFAFRAGASRLVHFHQSHPCRVFFPNMGMRGEPPVAVLANQTGGFVSGDRIRLAFGVDAGAALSVTTQNAEKIHRCDNCPDIFVEVGVSVAEDAWLDWLPRPSILFEGARLRRRTAFSLAPGGRLLACDTWIFGRRARGERFARGSLRDRWSVAIDGRLAWVDALHLGDDPAAAFAAPHRLDGAAAMATAFYAAGDAGERLELARGLLADTEGRAGVTLVGGDRILLARFLGDTPQAVRRDLDGYLGALRRAVGPYSATLPRIGND